MTGVLSDDNRPWLAQVIALPGALAAAAPDRPPTRSGPRDSLLGHPEEIAHATGVLERMSAGKGAGLRGDLGRRALRAEQLLAFGPTAVDPSAHDAATAVARARVVRPATNALVGVAADESVILAEALGADLDGWTLADLHEVADAVVELSTAPPAAPAWGSRTRAELAAVVLESSAAELRASAAAHRSVYAAYSQRIWDVPETVLDTGRRWYRPLRRHRLRQELRAASRDGRTPRGARHAATRLLDARHARGRAIAIAPLVGHHLGPLDRGPLTDVDAALSALHALRRLHRALGDRTNEARLEDLIRADAFRAEQVHGPAALLRTALEAWVRDVAPICVQPWGTTLDDLAAWVGRSEDAVPALCAATAEAERLGLHLPNLRALVDLLLVRERIEDLRIAATTPADAGAGSVS